VSELSFPPPGRRQDGDKNGVPFDALKAKPPGYAGALADDGTRTHDLLHGKPLEAVTPFRRVPRKRGLSRETVLVPYPGLRRAKPKTPS
jgi:hypothetical protein